MCLGAEIWPKEDWWSEPSPQEKTVGHLCSQIWIKNGFQILSIASPGRFKLTYTLEILPFVKRFV